MTMAKLNVGLQRATYNITEAGQRLGIGYQTIINLINDGYLDAIKYPNRDMRISERAIQDYIVKGESRNRMSVSKRIKKIVASSEAR